jgi:hypothetical protein
MCRRFDSGPVHWKTQEVSRREAFGRVNAALRHGPGGTHRVTNLRLRKTLHRLRDCGKLAPVPDLLRCVGRSL